MARSIIQHSKVNSFNTKLWEVTGVQSRYHYQTGELIAYSVYLKSGKLLPAKLWLYIHKREPVDITERGHQLAEDGFFLRKGNLYLIDAGCLALRLEGRSEGIFSIRKLINEHSEEVVVDLHFSFDTYLANKFKELQQFMTDYC